MMTTFFKKYISQLNNVLNDYNWDNVALLAADMHTAFKKGSQVFICGNGGSAANALHFSTDLMYGISKTKGVGIKAHALTANMSMLTCFANDLSYEEVFSAQLGVLGREGDILIVLSGSGNSPNVISVINLAKRMGIKSYAILGYSGGRCLKLADVSIHFQVDDMQISEDLQLIVAHMVMQWLNKQIIKGK